MRRSIAVLMIAMGLFTLAGCSQSTTDDTADDAVNNISPYDTTEPGIDDLDFELEPMDDPSFGEEVAPTDGSDLLMDVPEIIEDEPEVIEEEPVITEEQPPEVVVEEPPVAEEEKEEEVPLAGTGIYD